MLPKARICEYLDSRTVVAEKASTSSDSPWAGLHAELIALFGADAVGIFGLVMLGMHLTLDGSVRKDADFVIEGTGNIPVLREHLPAIRSRLGFTEVTSARQGRQYERQRRVFRNEKFHRPRHHPPVDRPAGPKRDRCDHPVPRPCCPHALPAGCHLPRPGQGHHRDRTGRRC